MEQFIGWDMNSKSTKYYIDECIQLLRNSTNLILNEETDNKLQNG